MSSWFARPGRRPPIFSKTETNPLQHALRECVVRNLIRGTGQLDHLVSQEDRSDNANTD
jgi:hypothetical protein